MLFVDDSVGVIPLKRILDVRVLEEIANKGLPDPLAQAHFCLFESLNVASF